MDHPNSRLFHVLRVVVGKHVSVVRLGSVLFGIERFPRLLTMIDVKIISGKEYEEMKKRKRFTVRFGFLESPLGKCLIGLSDERICHFSFVTGDDSANLDVLKSQWPDSVLVSDEELAFEMSKKIFESEGEVLKVLLKGTLFEGEVWRALVRIPRGETASYEDVATAAGRQKAVRAAANAVAKNPVAYLVPCHRVIRKDGSLHKYRWGSDVKRRILLFEKRNS